MRILWTVTFAVVTGMGLGAMRAQEREKSSFEMSLSSEKGRKVLVVTDAEPKVRHECRIRSFDADTIICGGRHGKAQGEYRRTDVLAVIRPAHHDSLFFDWLICSSPGVAMIVTGAVLSFPGATAVIVVGALVVFEMTGLVAMGDDSSSEAVLYLAPGRSLP